jgi:hypothetical protein
VKDMNAAGQIVLMDSGPLTSACIWDNGQWTNLPDINGGIFGAAYGLNDAGLAVGMSWPNQQNAKAATWRHGQISLLPVPQGTTESCACDVNNSGQIVGYYTMPGTARHACLWDADGAFHDLSGLVTSEPGWASYGWRINDVGQIGVQLNSPGTAFLLTPVPEPSTLALLAAAGLGLAGWGWRKRNGGRQHRILRVRQNVKPDETEAAK